MIKLNSKCNKLCPLNLICLHNNELEDDNARCLNHIYCRVVTYPWQLPYEYKVINGVPTLTVINRCDHYPVSDIDASEELNILIHNARILAGWAVASSLEIHPDPDEIPF